MINKKNVLILTGKSGGGHLSIAQSFCYWLNKWGYNAQIYNIIPVLNKKINDFLYHTPRTYKSLFKISNRYPLADIMTFSFHLDLERKLKKSVPNYSLTDIVISTHPLVHPQKGKIRIMIVPDPTVHATYKAVPKADYYFIFWPEALERAKKIKINNDRLIVTNPLARISFYRIGKLCQNEKNRQQIRQQLGISSDTKIGLVMAGSEWINRVKNYLDPLASEFSQKKVLFVFLCGKNIKFMSQLSAKYSSLKIFKFLGWLDEEEVATWMNAADFGIAFSLAQMSAEAGLSRLPIFIFSLMSGQEEKYRDVVENRGVGFYLPGKPKIQVAVLKSLYPNIRNLLWDNLELWQDTLLKTPDQMRKMIDGLGRKSQS
ncbi:hypothetical protein COS81_03345 [candidate division WWE3 bacterium CG06_land_8_20_14_3_00_42_16]|uniref:Uncharacterized protein n=4 Tax=Katanobacteria TaxID=422282 RepID=A0A2M7AMJ8_UNCKA|nr:MAG: hypothetical protein AUJ38_03545 [bacterium CG1_02_42_9]PIU68618.1 MAG: hypothetical protein COS81_03345 [candidate division WWE3 bacterium CG06_land_8_20_14_3_00_42_16]PIZ43860.1 MAG: hypothetical protein COY34_00220 [candidate division WWE3 bacterium CG_4_10_14_0_2_um_filter_42_8]PJA38451.1 MAG: hypothetical protein CO181_00370 [candidate division WWE3 bacterium CG_4_9_14_3_um_filter_43_9]PJC67989.1 MAG: hypothetical protein CO015_05660 [candidate division WWE3 bacterium CG_4_8_14_3_u